MSNTEPSGPLSRRLLWFVALWLGGVAAVTLVSLILRMWIGTN